MTGTGDRQRSEETLRARARDLGHRRLEAEEQESLGVFVVVRRGETSIAIPIDRCDEVRRITAFLAPGCGPVVAGVFQVRARALALIDLAGLDGSAEPMEHGTSTFAVLVHSDAGAAGLRIDEVMGVRELLRSDLDLDLSSEGSGFVNGVTRDLTEILDVDALLASPAVRSRSAGRAGRKR